MSKASPRVTNWFAIPQWAKGVAPWLVGLVMAGVVAALLLTLAGTFYAKVPEVASRGEGLPKVSEEVAAVRAIRRPRWEMAVGTIKPVRESTISSKLLARVVEVRVRAGQNVEADEVLVRLDDADLQARLRQAEASERTATALQEQALAEVERARGLIAINAVSRAELERAEAAAKTTQAEVERARQSVLEAKVLLGYTVIRSPMAGTVVDKRVEEGDTVLPGQVLLNLYDPSQMQMVASVRESLALQLQVGQQLPARIEALDHECQATVSEIVPESQAASRSFQVKVAGPCPPGVYSGMFARLMLPVGEEDVLVVPAAAIRHVGQLALVEVVQHGEVRRRVIQVGRELEEGIEVLSGLRDGEQVLVADSGATGESR